MRSEDAKAVKKEEAEEDNKSLRSFVCKEPTNTNNGGSSRKLKKEKDDDDDYKPIKSSLSRSLPKPVKKEEIDENSSAGVSKGLLGGQFQTTLGRRLKLALDFISDVKETFDDEPAKYKKFIKILKDFKARIFDEASSLVRLVKLMKDDDHLLSAFAILIPEAKQHISSHDHRRKRVDQCDGADFMNKPKTRSQSRRETDAAQQQVY